MKLIDAGKLLEHIKDLPTWWADDGGVYGESMKYPSGMFDCEDVVGSIENALTVDAVVVTRCKDCEHLVNATVNDNGFLICDVSDMEIAPDDFCSYGEPKEGANVDDHD